MRPVFAQHAAILICAVAAACTSPIHKRDELDPSSGVRTLSIDAKQRIVLFAPNPKSKTQSSAAPGQDNAGSKEESGTAGESARLVVTCAEPSPDALSAL